MKGNQAGWHSSPSAHCPARRVEQRRLPVLADERVAIGVGRGRAAALLLQQDAPAVVQEAHRHPARCAGGSPPRRVVGEAGLPPFFCLYPLLLQGRVFLNHGTEHQTPQCPKLLEAALPLPPRKTYLHQAIQRKLVVRVHR